VRRPAALVVLVLALVAAGCASRGPATIERDRFDYNNAIVRTSDEQMLLNLVRLKYRDTPMFLEVSNVSTQYAFTAEAAAGVELLGGDDLYGLGGGAGYEERPTVSYAPLQGEQFVRRVLSPIPYESLSLLSRSGWSVERVLRTCVQRINEIPNAPTASGPTPDRAPRFQEFRELAAALRQLQLAEEVRLDRVAGDDGRVAGLLRIGDGPRATGSAQRFKQLLGLPQDRDSFVVYLDPAVRQTGELTVVTRSLLGSLYYLSQGVEVPREHVERGWVTRTRAEDGSEFDWREVTGDLFAVKSSRERPDDAFLRVFYRGHWFFIDDADLQSKTTFNLLGMLFSLQAGSVESVAPVLTLPVGR
jgi:hypothetical protein